MKCPNCGNEAQEDAVFCDHCGLRLRQPTVPAVAPAAPSPETPAIAPVALPAADRGSVCQKCGASNLPGELFCGECGAPLAAPQPEPAAVAQVQAAMAPQATSGGPRLCPGCGAQVADGDEFCYACGADLRLAATTPAAAAPPAAAPATRGAQSVPPDMASSAPTAQPTPMAPAVAAAPVAPTIAATECPTCGGKVNPGDSFCDNCGAALNVPGQGAAPGQPAPVAAAAQPVVPTPVAAQPTAVSTPPVAVASSVVTQAPPVAPEPATSVAGPRLVVVASGAEIPLPVGQEAMVGREDPYSGVFPDIDLTPHGAEQGGVSRRHFKITYAGGQYVIEDLNSTNFTVVNRQRLQPGAPAVLSDDDEIRAGRVVLVFKVGA